MTRLEVIRKAIENRHRAEQKLNRELQQLRNDMEKSRCNECGFTGYEHQEWCPKRKA